MRQKQNTIYETLKKWNKSREVTRLAEASASAESLGTNAKNNNEEFIVAAIDFGADGKIAKKIQDIVKGISANISMVIVSGDDEGEKYGYMRFICLFDVSLLICIDLECMPLYLLLILI